MHHERLGRALHAAVSAVLVGCSGPSAVEVVEPPTSSLPPDAYPPLDLEEFCADRNLGQLTPALPSEYLEVRSYSTGTGRTALERWGEPCGGASEPQACLNELWPLIPARSGWGGCDEECFSTGLIGTSGDRVWMADSAAEVRDALTFESRADALFIVAVDGYSTDCLTMKLDGERVMWVEGSAVTQICPYTVERRQLSVTGSEVEVHEVLEVIESDYCVGRRPAGLQPHSTCEDAVAVELVAMARLEAAAVVAFERLANELEQHGAPRDLVDRARASAADEVRHAASMTQLATARGIGVPPIVVEPARDRSLLELAVENAVEGCSRETFGVAEALFRAQQAPTVALRALFAGIAADELRHAALAWDIDAWVRSRLPEVGPVLDRAREDSWVQMRAAVAKRADAVDDGLGGPSVPTCLHLIDEVRARVA